MTPHPSPLHPARHRINVLCARGIVAAGLGMATLGGLLGAVPAVASPQLTQAHADAAAGENTMAARVRSLYVSGGPTALYASVLESHDLSDVFSRFRSVRAVAEGDQAVVDLTAVRQVESALADAADRQNRLE